MELSKTIATTAVVLGVILAAGYAQGQPEETNQAAPAGAIKTAQERIAEREAQRRAAVHEQERRKEAYERACNKPLKSDADRDLCKAAYKRLDPEVKY